MKPRLRVYVAGPISQGDLAHNLRQAKEAGVAIMAAGMAPLVPHFTCYYKSDTPEVKPFGVEHETWLECDFAWLSIADAVLRLPGASAGADAEVAFAKENGIPVFDGILPLLAWKDTFALPSSYTPPVTPPESRPYLTGTDRRRQVLKDVEGCVCRDRQNSYGDAETNFDDIATIWSILLRNKLKEPINAVDVASCSAGIKLARIRTSPEHRDNFIDLAGYAVCGAGILDGKP